MVQLGSVSLSGILVIRQHWLPAELGIRVIRGCNGQLIVIYQDLPCWCHKVIVLLCSVTTGAHKSPATYWVGRGFANWLTRVCQFIRVGTVSLSTRDLAMYFVVCN
jgi:hypothetical protein